MKTLKFEGSSDDTFMCNGPGIDVDYDTCASGKPVYIRVEAGGSREREPVTLHGADGAPVEAFRLKGDKREGFIVRGQYAPNNVSGGWSIGVQPEDTEDDCQHIPTWPMRFERGDREYSPVLVVETPDDVRVKVIQVGDREIEEEVKDE
jgi:hypothetical protein